jgi:hypothetical protein
LKHLDILRSPNLSPLFDPFKQSGLPGIHPSLWGEVNLVFNTYLFTLFILGCASPPINPASEMV